MREERDNFSKTIAETIKRRAAFICSAPDCKRMTVAPSISDQSKVQQIGVCSHITAAVAGGPRYDKKLSKEERCDIANAIFLCNSCSVKIDKNKGIDYSVKTLRKWKNDHEKWVLEHLNKSVTSDSGKTSMKNNTRQNSGINANIVNIHSLNANHSDIGHDQKRSDHDMKIFRLGEKIISETLLIEIIETLLGNESIKMNHILKVNKLIYFYEKPSNTFLTKSIESQKVNFHTHLGSMADFFMKEFDKYPYEQKEKNFNVCMRPTANIDRAGDLADKCMIEHEKLEKILKENCKNLRSAYSEFRKQIQKNLYI